MPEEVPEWCARAPPIVVADQVTFWLLLHSLAHRLLTAVRDHVAALVAPLATIQMDTLRLRVLKLAAYLRQSVRRIVVQFPRAISLSPLFRRLLERARLVASRAHIRADVFMSAAELVERDAPALPSSRSKCPVTWPSCLHDRTATYPQAEPPGLAPWGVGGRSGGWARDGRS